MRAIRVIKTSLRETNARKALPCRWQTPSKQLEGDTHHENNL